MTTTQPLLTIEVPGRAVSANARLGYNRATGRRYLRQPARQWKDAVALEAFVAEARRLGNAGRRAKPLPRPLRVVCHVYGTCADADNLAKLILDGLAEGIGIDDKHFRPVEMHATRKERANPRAVIEVWEAEAEAKAGAA